MPKRRAPGIASSTQLPTPARRSVPASYPQVEATGSQHTPHHRPLSPDVKVEEDVYEDSEQVGDLNDPRRYVSPSKLGPRRRVRKQLPVEESESDDQGDNNGDDDESDTDVLALVAGSGVRRFPLRLGANISDRILRINLTSSGMTLPSKRPSRKSASVTDHRSLLCRVHLRVGRSERYHQPRARAKPNDELGRISSCAYFTPFLALYGMYGMSI